MNFRERIKSWKPVYFISFFLPLIIMIAIFAVRGIYPFGDNVYLRSDMYHQYCPFFSELWNKIHNGESLFYSWNIGLGSNFTALYGYYLSSPLNWFIGLFPHKYMIEMMNIIILIKLSLASVAFTFYISRRFGKSDMTVAVFSLFYALSGFTAAYSWNLMWFDCVALLPVAILGLESLVKEDKGLMYTISLGLIILSNYYIAIMVCISMVLYFIVLLVTMPVPERKSIYLQKIGYFTLFSMLAGGLAAAILVPELYALGLTASGDFSFPKTLTRYFSMVTVLTRHLANTPVCIGLEHLPNIYCSVAVFLLFPLYIFNKRISAREKAAKTLLLFVFIFAFSFNIPNFIWHGFHYPNSLPARQSFVYIFVLLTMCYDAFQDMKVYSDSSLIKSLGLFLVYLLFLDHVSEDTPGFAVLYVNAFFLAAYVLLAYIYRKTKLKIHFVVFLLLCLTCVECTMNMEETGYSTTGRKYYFDDYKSIDTITENLEERDDSFYRIAKVTGYRSKNDAAWHGFKNASVFSSTAYQGATDLFGRLGLEHSMNAYADHGATPFVYSLLNIKYMISEDELNDPYTLQLVEKVDNQYLYEAKYTLPVGFMVRSDINKAWDYRSSNPFGVQNDFVREMIDTDELLFSVLQHTDNDKSGITVTLEEDSYVYVYVGNKSVKNVQVIRDGATKTYSGINHGRMVDLGWCKAGAKITIKDKECENSLNAMTYTMNPDLFIKAYEELSKQGFDVTKHDSDSLYGTINVTTPGIMMTSIPYDEGWTVKVDGKKAELVEVAEALIGIELSAGEHTIEFDYTPRGLYQGMAISAVSLVILFLVYCFYRKENGKAFLPFGKKPAQEIPEEPAEETTEEMPAETTPESEE